MQKYWDSQAASVCVMQKTHGEEPSSWFISVIFQCMKKGLRPNGYFPLTRQPLFLSDEFSVNSKMISYRFDLFSNYIEGLIASSIFYYF